MTNLRRSAQALVDRWDTPLWMDVPHTAKYIDALRAALVTPSDDTHRLPETEAWLIRLSNGTRFIHGHNSIGDFRAIDPEATVTELIPRAAPSPQEET